MTSARLPLRDVRIPDRVREHSSARVNERIDRLTKAALDDVSSQGRDAMIQRLKALDREWDVDRAVMLTFSVVGTSAGLLSRTGRRGWRYVLGAQLGFLLLNALVGWCPPLPVLRRLGFRTTKEIDAERAELQERLKALAEGQKHEPLRASADSHSAEPLTSGAV